MFKMRRINLLLTGLAAAVLGGCSVPLVSHGNGISKDMRNVVDTVKKNGERAEITDFIFTDMVMHDNLSGRSKYVREFERLRKDSPSYSFDASLIDIVYSGKVRAVDGVQWVDTDSNVVVGYVLNDRNCLATYFIRPNGDEIVVEEMTVRIKGRTHSRIDGKPEIIMRIEEQKEFPLINMVGTVEVVSPYEPNSGLQDSIKAEYHRAVQDYVRNKGKN